MKCFAKILGAVVFAGAAASGASAHTFLVDTWEMADRADLEEEARFCRLALESGMMDVLFEEGHIFFNIYSSPSATGTMPVSGSALALAGEEGADYLIELVPDDDGASWKVYGISGMLESGGYVSIDGMDEELETVERWMALGNALASDVLSAVG